MGHEPNDAAQTQPDRFAAIDVMRAMVTFQRRNIEAAVKVQEALFLGNKSLVEQQFEIAKSAAARVLKPAQEITSDFQWKANLRAHFGAAKNAMQETIGNANVVAEIGARSGAQAVQIAHERAYDAMDEIQAMLERIVDAYFAAPRRGTGLVSTED